MFNYIVILLLFLQNEDSSHCTFIIQIVYGNRHTPTVSVATVAIIWKMVEVKSTSYSIMGEQISYRCSFQEKNVLKAI